MCTRAGAPGQPAGCLQSGRRASPGCSSPASLAHSLLPFGCCTTLLLCVNVGRSGFETQQSSRPVGRAPTLVCARAPGTACAKAAQHQPEPQGQHPPLPIALLNSLCASRASQQGGWSLRHYTSAGSHIKQAVGKNLAAVALARPPRATQGCKPLSCKQLAGRSMLPQKVRDVQSWLG